jgi:hypothetical protein
MKIHGSFCTSYVYAKSRWLLRLPSIRWVDIRSSYFVRVRAPLAVHLCTSETPPHIKYICCYGFLYRHGDHVWHGDTRNWLIQSSSSTSWFSAFETRIAVTRLTTWCNSHTKRSCHRPWNTLEIPVMAWPSWRETNNYNLIGSFLYICGQLGGGWVWRILSLSTFLQIFLQMYNGVCTNR